VLQRGVPREDQILSSIPRPSAQSAVQFATVNGRRVAVLSAEDWEALVEWLETLEDTQLAREALDKLRAAGGDPEKAC